jgi:glucose-1-phosphate thymidylyltransferase
MSILLFEDLLVERLSPITLARPAWAISCGAMRLIDLLVELDRPIYAAVRPHLRDLVAADFPLLTGKPVEGLDVDLLVNARVVPCQETRLALRKLLAEGKPGVIEHDGAIAAAIIPAEHLLPANTADSDAILQWVDDLDLPVLPGELPCLDYPHDVVRYNKQHINENLEHRIAAETYQQLGDGLFVADGVTIGKQVVCDSSAGPIVLERDVTVGHLSVLTGPIYIGHTSRIAPHAVIKDAVTIGHTTKIGGEVVVSVIEPYSNKQHHGFLGHSHVGSWVNLGAGTSNSDLKNTYGLINAQYGQQRVATGMQLLGCFLGDYCKTAINTSIFTGKTVGVCSMLYGFVTTNVPSFANYARSLGQVTASNIEVMLKTQERMFARRGVQPRECDRQLIRDLHALTRGEHPQQDDMLSL